MRLITILAIHTFTILDFVLMEEVFSNLTDGENKALTSVVNTKLECYEFSILRQMIDQETVIRLSLVKNVHALVGDVNLIKKSLVESETTIIELQQTVQALNIEVAALLLENNKLKNESIISKTKIMEQNSNLYAVNYSVTNLHENVNVIQEDSEKIRQELINKTNSVLDDVKIEVRNMSVTLLDLKDHLGTEVVPRVKRYDELERHFNLSLEDLKSENLHTKQECISLRAIIQNLTDSQMEIGNTLSERLLNIQPTTGPVGSVAFYAYLSSSIPASVAHRIISFDTVITNVGNAYHPQMGTFIAPRSGLYVFTWTIRLYGRSYHTTELVVNNSIVNVLYFNPNSLIDGSVSSTAVVHVNQGDDVLVRTSSDYHNGEIKSFPNGRSSFAGWILV